MLALALARSQTRTVIWAIGYRPDFSWVGIPVTGRNGHICHDGGVVTGAPGLYLLGMPVLRCRASTYIHGAEPDTGELSDHLRGYLASGHKPRGRPIVPVQLRTYSDYLADDAHAVAVDSATGRSYFPALSPFRQSSFGAGVDHHMSSLYREQQLTGYWL